MGPIELVKAVRERLKRQELHLGTGQGFYARVRMINDLAALCDLVERLEKALEFYADPNSYFAIGFLPDRPCGEFMEDFDECWDEHIEDTVIKPGKRARQALKGGRG